MSIQIAEISSETTANESVVKLQNAPKSITRFFDYVNSENPSIGTICREYGFEEINLRNGLSKK